jgi:glycosyltransferase involved in cell wall biosynthesis
MPKPRVSVLMPMKNTDRFVEAAVRSVLAQDLAELEVIVVDDGSTDRSRAVVQAVGDPRIRLVSSPGRGIAPALNHALELAEGDIVMGCDSDDLYPPNRIGAQVRFLDQHPEYAAVCGGFTTLDPAGRQVAELGSRSHGEEITNELLSGVTRTHLCSFAIRRPHFRTLGGLRGYFETGSDIDLQLRLAEIGRVFYQPESRYFWRLHDASVTHRQPSVTRQFFEDYAREMRQQRASGRRDDLALGTQREPPRSSSAPLSMRDQVQGMLLGRAWGTHGSGKKLEAVKLGLRALLNAPTSIATWKSVAAMLIKPAGQQAPQR